MGHSLVLPQPRLEYDQTLGWVLHGALSTWSPVPVHCFHCIWQHRPQHCGLLPHLLQATSLGWMVGDLHCHSRSASWPTPLGRDSAPLARVLCPVVHRWWPCCSRCYGDPPGHLPGMGMLLLHAMLCQAGKCAFIVSYVLKVLEMIGILTASRLSCFAYQIWWKINTRYRNYFSSCCTTQIAKTPTPTTKTTFFPSQSTAGLNGLSRARTKEKHRGQSWHF